jgi:hypothetical protein
LKLKGECIICFLIQELLCFNFFFIVFFFCRKRYTNPDSVYPYEIFFADIVFHLIFLLHEAGFLFVKGDFAPSNFDNIYRLQFVHTHRYERSQELDFLENTPLFSYKNRQFGYSWILLQIIFCLGLGGKKIRFLLDKLTFVLVF